VEGGGSLPDDHADHRFLDLYVALLFAASLFLLMFWLLGSSAGPTFVTPVAFFAVLAAALGAFVGVRLARRGTSDLVAMAQARGIPYRSAAFGQLLSEMAATRRPRSPVVQTLCLGLLILGLFLQFGPLGPVGLWMLASGLVLGSAWLAYAYGVDEHEAEFRRLPLRLYALARVDAPAAAPGAVSDPARCPPTPAP
jgi:hypothetical protein